ncbi:ANK [Mytilus edulis]|uniref:ANK n=1 Tax=Mytilus edulis TaxID=6550 RepID=A0A8S3RDL2_MYTED|nr:ANK [Mytilus edulis]
MTPLHIACNSGNADLVELLLKLKAKIDLKNTKVETCLLMVCKSGIIHIAKLLIKCNANVDIEDKLNKTPLSVALKSHNANLINLLQRHNAKDYRIQKKEDEVHKACREGNEEKVACLIKNYPPECLAVDDTVGQAKDQQFNAILECLVFELDLSTVDVTWYKENRRTLEKKNQRKLQICIKTQGRIVHTDNKINHGMSGDRLFKLLVAFGD